MKNNVMLLAGFLAASMAFAGSNDSIAEQRLQAKFGRSTSVQAQGCSRTMHAAASVGTSDQEARYAAKYGRFTPQEEARLQAAPAAAPADCCARMHGAAVAASAPTALQSHLRAKYGLSPAAPQQPMSASAAPACGHDCCNHGE